MIIKGVVQDPNILAIIFFQNAIPPATTKFMYSSPLNHSLPQAQLRLTNMGRSALLRQPVDVLHRIFSDPRLDTNDVANLRLTCGFLNGACGPSLCSVTVLEFASPLDTRPLRMSEAEGQGPQLMPLIEPFDPAPVSPYREPSAFFHRDVCLKGHLRVPLAEVGVWMGMLDHPKSFLPTTSRLVLIVDDRYAVAARKLAEVTNSLQFLPHAEAFPYFLLHILPSLSKVAQLDLLYRSFANPLLDPLFGVRGQLKIKSYNLRLVIDTGDEPLKIDHGEMKSLFAGANTIETHGLPLKVLATVSTKKLKTSTSILHCTNVLECYHDWNQIKGEPVKPSINFLGQFTALKRLCLGSMPELFYSSDAWIPKTLQTLKIKDFASKKVSMALQFHIESVTNLSLVTSEGRFLQHFVFDNLEFGRVKLTPHDRPANICTSEFTTILQSPLLQKVNLVDFPPSFLGEIARVTDPDIVFQVTAEESAAYYDQFISMLAGYGWNWDHIKRLHIEVKKHVKYEWWDLVMFHLAAYARSLESLYVSGWTFVPSGPAMDATIYPWAEEVYKPNTQLNNICTLTDSWTLKVDLAFLRKVFDELSTISSGKS